MKTNNFDKQIESLWNEMSEIRWQMKAYPQKNDFVRAKKILRLQDQIMEIQRKEKDVKLFREHLLNLKSQ